MITYLLCSGICILPTSTRSPFRPSATSLSRVHESPHLDPELLPGVEQGAEEVLARRPLAVEQVGDLAVLVVAHDVGHHLRDRAAEGCPIWCHLLGEVDGADLRQQVRRPRAGEPDQRTPVRGVEDAYQPIIRYFLHPLDDLRGGSGRGEQQPFAGGGADDERTVFVAGGASEGDAKLAGGFAVPRGSHKDFGERGTVDYLQFGVAAAGAYLPAVPKGYRWGRGNRATGDGRRLRHVGGSLQDRSGRAGA